MAMNKTGNVRRGLNAWGNRMDMLGALEVGWVWGGRPQHKNEKKYKDKNGKYMYIGIYLYKCSEKGMGLVNKYGRKRLPVQICAYLAIFEIRCR